MIGRRSSRLGGCGFSLLEAVIAAALLLVVVTSTTAVAAGVSHAGRRAESRMQADRALAAVIARLEGLPFCATAVPSTSAGVGPEATDLVAAVFPHAGGGTDSQDARFVATDSGGVRAGSFVTRFEEGGADITCVARFSDSVGGVPLGPSDLSGWDVFMSDRVPAPVLVVEVTAAFRRSTSSGRLTRIAAVDLTPAPAPTASVTP